MHNFFKFKNKRHITVLSLVFLTSLIGLTGCENEKVIDPVHHIPDDSSHMNNSPYRPVKKVIPKLFEDTPGSVKYCDFNNISFQMDLGKTYLLETAIVCNKTSLTPDELHKKYKEFSNDCIKESKVNTKNIKVLDSDDDVRNDPSLNEEEKEIILHENEHRHIFDEPSNISIYKEELKSDEEIANVYKFYLKPVKAFNNSSFKITFNFGEGMDMYIDIDFSCK